MVASARQEEETKLKVYSGEPETKQQMTQERFDAMSREQLAAMFDKMRKGQLKNDDWDW